MLFLVAAVLPICFLIIPYREITNTIAQNTSSFFQFYWSDLICSLLLVLLGISVLKRNIKFSKALCIILTVFYLLNGITQANFALLAIKTSVSIGFLLVVIAHSIRGEKPAKILCFIAAFIILFCLVIVIIFLLPSRYNLKDLIIFGYIDTTALILPIAFSFMGLYLSSTKVSEQLINNYETNKSSIEKISSLKSLLDKGIITQAEFEEKKKQILR